MLYTRRSRMVIVHSYLVLEHIVPLLAVGNLLFEGQSQMTWLAFPRMQPWGRLL